jgi:hypothetical protein
MATHTTSPTISYRPSGRGIPPAIKKRLDEFRTPKEASIPTAIKEPIESALLVALQQLRAANDAQAMQVATGKAIRAATMMKRACSALVEGGKA